MKATITDKKFQEVDQWLTDNTEQTEWGTLQLKTVQRRTRYTPRRRGATTHHYTITVDVRVPFKAPTLAGYIAKKFSTLDVDVSESSLYKGRQARSGIYYSRGTYNGYEITVYDTTQPNDNQYRNYTSFKRIFQHDTAETYRTNTEIVEFILDQIQKGVK